MIKEYAKQLVMDFVRYWLLGALTFVCVESVCGMFMINVCLHSAYATCFCVCDECMMRRYAWIHTKSSFVFMHAERSRPVIAPGSGISSPPPQTVTLLCASHDPRGWWLAELPASAILTDWSSMCYTPINGSNYQWARLWTLQTEVNKHNRSWGALRGWGGGDQSLY